MSKPQIKISNSSDGFTIIELLIASAVFSVILTVLVTGLIQVGKQYSSGLISSNTQATARSILSQVTQQIQFGANPPTVIDDTSTVPILKGYCIDNNRYSYVLDKQMLLDNPPLTGNTRYGLIIDSASGSCLGSTPQDLTGGSTGPIVGSELLSVGTRVAAFDISPVGPKQWQVEIKVIFGPDGALYVGSGPADPNYHQSCLNGLGSACAVSDLSAIVERRLN